MPDVIEELRREIESEPLDTMEAVDAYRVKYLGRKSGHITGLFKRIGEEVDRRVKGGEPQMKATMEVMKKYRSQLAAIMQK